MAGISSLRERARPLSLSLSGFPTYLGTVYYSLLFLMHVELLIYTRFTIRLTPQALKWGEGGKRVEAIGRKVRVVWTLLTTKFRRDGEMVLKLEFGL